MVQKLTVNVIGLGYVGIATSLYVADTQVMVHGWDICAERVSELKKGILPFREPDLLARFSQLGPQSFHFAERVNELPKANIWIICVGSPLNLKTGTLDTQDIRLALGTVLSRCVDQEDLKPLILLRSTVPPLTYQNELRPLIREFSTKYPKFLPRFFYFPEFLREGSALSDSQDPGLLPLGSEGDSENIEIIEAVFKLKGKSIDRVSIEVAEMLKVSSNAFHALKVTFANEVASLCRSLQIDGGEVMKIFVKDRKLNISPTYLRPGFAYGGPCLDKDLSAFNRTALNQKLDLPLLSSVRKSNEAHLLRASTLIEKVSQRAGNIGIVGTAFKEGCTDQRSSPVIQLIENLSGRLPDRRIHILDESEIDSIPIKSVVVHAKLSDLLSQVETIVLGPHPRMAHFVDEIAKFQGPIVDLMFTPASTLLIREKSNTHRVC